MRTIAASVNWHGRLSRRGFVARAASAIAVFAILFVFIEHVLGEDATLILYPPFFAAMLAMAARRLHDQARSAWWLMVPIFPVLGPLILAWRLLLTPGTRGANEYGEDPRLLGRDYLQVAIHEPA